MTRLGIPVDRITRRLNIDRKILSDFSDIIKPIKDDLKKGLPVPDLAKKFSFPELLIWSIALEKITDQERFKILNWGLLTWDHWYWNDVDYRFGDDWPGRMYHFVNIIVWDIKVKNRSDLDHPN